MKINIKSILKSNKFILIIILLLLNIFFIATTDYYFSLGNFINMLSQSSTIVIVGCAATLLMSTGNFDLSTGSNIAFSGILYTFLAVNGFPLFIASIGAILGGMCFGIINGFLV